MARTSAKMRKTPKKCPNVPSMTYVLAAIMIVVFILEIIFPWLIDSMAFSAERSLSGPWVAITAIFAHGDVSHLAANLLVLWFFGLAAERELGKRGMLFVFFLGALFGEFVSVIAYPGELSVGASGGIFALVGAVMILRPFETEIGHGWDTMPMTGPLPLFFLAAVYIAYNVIGIFSGPSDIAYAAHFAGLAVGLAVGILKKRRSRQNT
jgi:membrane associated rhomboid family serine protease